MFQRLFRLLAVATLAAVVSTAALAADQPIYRAETDASVDATYAAVKTALEERRFWAVLEVDIQDNISGFAAKWGADYNPAGLTALRSLVVCNGWFANKITGLDPDLAALCPLRVGFYGRGGKTVVVFARPTAMAAGSPGLAAVQEVEDIVIAGIEAGVAVAK